MKRLYILLEARDFGVFKCSSLLDSLVEFILEYMGVKKKNDVEEVDINQVRNIY